MQEIHRNEQYFFDEPTLARLAEVVQGFENPVLLCCPMLGQYLWERGLEVPVLDIDGRFSGLPGFVHWNIHRPAALPVKPDLLVCDPPFWTVKLDRLYRAFMALTHGDPTVPVVMTWLGRREHALLGTLHQFGLEPTPFRPGYVTVSPEVGIRMYASGGVMRGQPAEGGL
jgi:hypothetical protein